jgi:hypothetical protein
MNSLTKAFSYLIAAQFQAIGLIFAAWWIGDWLNKHHPMQLSWYAVTFSVGVLGVVQTFYVIMRQIFKKNEDQKAGSKKP